MSGQFKSSPFSASAASHRGNPLGRTPTDLNVPLIVDWPFKSGSDRDLHRKNFVDALGYAPEARAPSPCAASVFHIRQALENWGFGYQDDHTFSG